MSFRFNELKFDEMLHYIIAQCGRLPNTGKTVLYKLLYFSDFDFYEIFERPISGEKYRKLQHGPAPSNFDNSMLKLKREGKIKEIRSSYGGLPQNKFISLNEPELSHLNAEELKMINNVINKLSSMNATQISAFSHGDMPWKATKNNDVIDYELVFYRNDMYSVREDDDVEV